MTRVMAVLDMASLTRGPGTRHSGWPVKEAQENAELRAVTYLLLQVHDECIIFNSRVSAALGAIGNGTKRLVRSRRGLGLNRRIQELKHWQSFGT